MTPAQQEGWRYTVALCKSAPDHPSFTVPTHIVLAVEADRAALLEALKECRSQMLKWDSDPVALDKADALAREALAKVEGKQ